MTGAVKAGMRALELGFSMVDFKNLKKSWRWLEEMNNVGSGVRRSQSGGGAISALQIIALHQ